MMLLTIPLRYTRAKWMRTLLLVAVFAFGVASMTGLHQISQLIGDSFEKKLISYGANVLITPKRETLTISYGGYTLGDVTLDEQWIALAEARESINAMPLRSNIAVVAPKIIAPVKIHGNATALVGVDWKAENNLKGYWEVNGELPEPGAANDLLAGSALAEKLQLQPGQQLDVNGRVMHVRGILHATGGDDDTVLFTDIATVQEMTGRTNQAAFIEVAALCSGCPIDDIVTQLQQALPGTEVRALRQVAESRMYAVHFAQNLAFSVSIVILVTACAMIIMSMFSSVTERRKEIGIMRAVGFSRGSIFTVFVTEGLAVGLFAGALGHLAGYMLAGYVLEQLHLVDTVVRHFSYGDFAVTVGMVAAAAALSAALPAWRASLIEPAEALVAL